MAKGYKRQDEKVTNEVLQEENTEEGTLENLEEEIALDKSEPLEDVLEQNSVDVEKAPPMPAAVDRSKLAAKEVSPFKHDKTKTVLLAIEAFANATGESTIRLPIDIARAQNAFWSTVSKQLDNMTQSEFFEAFNLVIVSVEADIHTRKYGKAFTDFLPYRSEAELCSIADTITKNNFFNFMNLVQTIAKYRSNIRAVTQQVHIERSIESFKDTTKAHFREYLLR